MVEPVPTWRERQSRVLTEFRERKELKRADVVRLTGLTYWQVEGVETGKSALPAKWIPTFAEAVGVDPAVLTDALFEPEIPTPEDQEIRAILEEAGLPEDDIKTLILETRRLSQHPVRLAAIQAAIQAAISLYREAHPEAKPT